MHNTALILTLTSALTAGLIFGYITHCLRLSPIVGYLLAGVVIGPFTPGFFADQHLVEQLAEVGAMMLMFGVGLHFRLEDLLAVRAIAIPGAIAQIAVGTLLGACTARYFGWGWDSGLIYGLSLSVASTVVLTRILVDNNALHSQIGHTAIGWLIVEDIFTVIALVLVPVFFTHQETDQNLSLALFTVILKIITLVALAFVFGSRLIPWLFSRVAMTGSQELFTLCVLATALGIAVASSILFEVSMALGAFLAGMIVGKSDFSLRAATEVLPIRDAFAALFFVSIGMLIDPAVMIANPIFFLATVLIVILGKSLAAFLIIVLLGHPTQVALGVAVALAQIGEFSFILSSLGKQLGLLDTLASHTLAGTAIVSITINPLLYRLMLRLDGWMASRPQFFSKLVNTTTAPAMQMPVSEQLSSCPINHVIIIGYGPIGKMVCQLLEDHGLKVIIIELNLAAVHDLRSKNIEVIYGNACRRETLEKAFIKGARNLILSASSISEAGELVRIAKELNPEIRVMARTSYIWQVKRLKRSGCEMVFSGEGEVALALAEAVLKVVDAPSEVIKEKTEIVKAELTKR